MKAMTHGSRPNMSCLSCDNFQDFYENVYKSKYWALPTSSAPGVFRLDLLFAVCSAIPILLQTESKKLHVELEELMDVKSVDASLGFVDLTESTELGTNHHKLREGARRRLDQYLKDTTAMETHFQFLQVLTGDILVFIVY